MTDFKSEFPSYEELEAKLWATEHERDTLIEQRDDLKNACTDWQLDHQSMVLEIKRLEEKHQRDLHDWAIAHAEQLNKVIRATAEECASLAETLEVPLTGKAIASAIREHYKEGV